MELQNIRLWIHILCVLVASLASVLVMAVALTCRPGKILLQTFEEVGRNLRRSKNSFLDYERLKGFLERNGAAFHFGRWIGPINYTAIRLVLAGAGLLLGSFYEMWLGVILTVLFFILPDMMVTWMNSRDNDRMLPELKLIYNAIAMQIKSGVHVTDALAECYSSVQEGRLREALFTLSGDIVMQADVEKALERFQGKFENRYVDALCITVLQALESGQAVELLSDISEQIKDMEVAIMGRKKSSLDRRITFYQLGILSAILVVVLYACITHMLAAAVSF